MKIRVIRGRLKILRRYTLPKSETLAKLITLIINSFCSMLCRGVLQTPTQIKPFSPPFLDVFLIKKVAFTDCPPSGVRGQLLIINY